MRKTRWKVTTTVVAAGLAAALTGGAAFAAVGNEGVYDTTFVDGQDSLTDDFGDHYSELGHSLCNGCADSRNTDLVILWQAILFSEGLLPCSGIDGTFGSITAAATKKWQSRYGLTDDGWVGANTWAKADNRLGWYYDAYGIEYLRYSGTAGAAYFTRGDWNDHYGGGAYNLYAAATDSVTARFNTDIQRIYFKQRTIQVSCS